MAENTYRVAPFSQSAYLDAGTNPSSAGGACHMFALKWLSEIIHDKSAGSQARMDTLIRYAREVRVLYKAFSARWSREGEVGADEGVAKMVQLTVDDIISYPSIALLSKAARDQHRKGYVYTFRFAGGGAHSIAFYRSGATFGGHLYAMDPNLGEYKMGKGQLMQWVRWLDLIKYSAFGAITSHQLRPVSAYVSSGSRIKGGVKIM